ncbi:hypothetical protein [Rhodococcoides trifolii]|nr:hypothetical protein [Rhodococcus trifolii]
MLTIVVGTLIGVAVLSWPALSAGDGLDFNGRQVAQTYRGR